MRIRPRDYSELSTSQVPGYPAQSVDSSAAEGQSNVLLQRLFMKPLTSLLPACLAQSPNLAVLGSTHITTAVLKRNTSETGPSVIN